MAYSSAEWHDLLVAIQQDLATRDLGVGREELWHRVSLAASELVAATLGRMRNGLSGEDVADIGQWLLERLQEPAFVARVAGLQGSRSFLRVTVRNRALDILRRRATERRTLLNMGVFRSPVMRPFADIGRLLTSINDDERELLRLRFWEDLTLAEMALRLNEPYSRVATQFYRLLRKLKRIAEKDGLLPK